jgi:gliding motility-associated-like protein
LKRLLQLLVFVCLLLSASRLGAQCTATFSADSTVCDKDTVQFTYTGTSAATYQWDFDDIFSGQSNTDTIQNPKHVFTQPGSYNVRLVVNDTGTCSDTFYLRIQVAELPIASFTYNNPCVGLNTIFNSTSVSDSIDGIKTWDWDFGDGGTASDTNPTHGYNDTGSYNARLIVVTNFGCIDTITQTVTQFDSLTVSKDIDTLCYGSQVKFNVSTNTSTGVSWNWDFGDSTSSILSSPDHQYNKSGTFQYSVKVTYGNGKTCHSDSGLVKVHPLPDPQFTLLSDSIQCFTDNEICIKLNKPYQGLTFRSIAFDDGFVDNTSSLSDSIICHKYTDPLGGKYIISISLLDSNSCSSTYTTSDTITIHPELIASFADTVANGCFKTDILLTNNSNFSPTYVTKFMWDFGDGTLDSTNWNGFIHRYTNDGNFNISLALEDKFGCTDTFQSSSQITNISYIVDALLDSNQQNCYSGNIFRFKQTQISGAIIKWYFGDGDSSFNWNTAHRYDLPGIYKPWVVINKAGCDSTVQLDSAVIYGPRAIIGNVVNRYQCQIVDTISMRNNSVTFMNGPLSVLWNANDPFSPNCTQNTVNNQNIGLNCRFSEDSLLFKHMYSPGQENCYFPRLIVSDSTTGCADTTFTTLPLTAPDASTGINFLSTVVCPGPESSKEVIVGLDSTLPSCGRQYAWVMWDSLCAEQSGNFDSFWTFNDFRHNYDYNNLPCDSNGNITIGIIIENGQDSLGNPCRDTAFYHHVLNLSPLDPRFNSSYDSAQHYCENTQFDFTLNDTTQDSITRMVWNWGDGTSDTNIDMSTRQHTYANSGSFLVVLTLENNNGCISIDSMRIRIGLTGFFTTDKAEICLGDTVTLNEIIRYYGDWVPHWSDSARKAQGKETLIWNFDDGNGFVNTDPSPTVIYNKIGSYNIQLAAKDSLGCLDTFTLASAVRVFDIKADFTTVNDTLVCEQLVDFYSQTSTYDSINGFGHPDDSVATFGWTFMPGNSSSNLENPSKFLKAGTHTVSLVATNTRGCTDSTTKDVTIVGPTSDFEIITDSIGCQPLTVTFKNNSKNANAYAWYFRDNGNNTLNTSSDSNITFTYTDHGTFYPYLIAQGIFIKNGISITCQTTFPDSIMPGIREITVYETPKPRFTHVTDCKTNTTTFTNRSYITTGNIIRYEWDFGDGDTSTQLHPVHQYPDTGKYVVVLRTFSDLGCIDSLVRQITISPFPNAWFGFTEVCLGNQTTFTDSTFAYNDVIYQWDWDFGDSTGSNFKDPVKTYTKDSTYSVRLITTNIAGCKDTISRDVRVHNIPSPQLNYLNACTGMPVKLYNLTTVVDSPTTVLWDFGDGTTGTSNNWNKYYASPGTYTVTLTATSSFGCTDSIKQLVDSYILPTADFTIDDTIQCQDRNLFNLLSTSTVDTGLLISQWTMGLTQKSSYHVDTVSHRFNEYGTIPISLITKTYHNCRDTLTRYVIVEAKPDADLSVNDTSQCLIGNKFVLTDMSSSVLGSYARKWDTENGQFPTDSIISRSYSDTGVYRVRLMLESPNTCRDTLTRYLHVNAHPKALFTIDDSAQCLGQNLFSFTDNSQTAYTTTTCNWNFGDGNTSILKNPNHSYLTSDTFSVSLISTNDRGCMDTVNRPVITHPMPQANFTIDDDRQCELSNLFTFTNKSIISSGSLTYNWTFGDNNSSILKDPTHTYDTFGLYPVQLIATSLENCADTVGRNVVVNPTPIANFSINDTAQCYTGHGFTFQDLSTIPSGGFTRNWDFGDNTSSTLGFVTKTYSAPGTYTVKLVITSNTGCMDSITKTVVVHPNSIPDFDIADSIQCERNNIFSFTNNTTLSSGTFTSLWQFGDGDTAQTRNTTHSYDTFGTYTVQLLTTTEHACADSISKQIRINPMPDLFAGINDSAQCVNDQTFFFYDSSTIAEGTYSRLWTFGDNSNSTARTVNKSYDTAGTYPVKLLLTSDKNCTDSFETTVTVYPQTYSSFDISDSIQCEFNNLFSFTDKTTLLSGNYTNKWFFGDGDSSISMNPSHSYDTFGTYTVLLITESNNNCLDSISKDIRVNPMPTVNASVNDSTQCVNNQLFVFADSSSIAEGTFSRLWNFGDGKTSTSNLVSKMYDTAGTYNTVLVLTSDENCSDSFEKIIEVHPQSYSSFDILDSVQCEFANTFDFTNTSTLSAGSYTSYWNFGDGDTLVGQNATHSYDTFGTYTVRLITETNFSCVDTTSKLVRVNPMPTIHVGVDDSAQCLNQQLFTFFDSSNIAEGSFNRLWLLGENDSSTLQFPTKIFATDGTFNVWLKLISDKSCSDSVKLDITVHPKPEPGFEINDSTQCVNPNEFIFNSTSTINSGGFTYNWYFGDGNTSQFANDTHAYLNHGNYNVQLILQSDKGCVDSLTKPVEVYPKPITGITANDSGQCENDNLVLLSSSSIVPYSTISKYFWDLGDGFVEGSKDTSRTYSNYGTKVVRFIAETEFGCRDTSSLNIEIHPIARTNFSINDPDQCLNGNLFQFNNSTTIPSGTVTYDWDFGNGQTDTATSPSLTFTAHDTLTVTLVTTSDQGCLDTTEQQIIIYPQPTPMFAVNDTAQCLSGNSFIFTDGSTIDYGALNYQWRFGDGNSSAQKDPSHSYISHDSFTVTLTVNSGEGCIDSVNREVVVHPQPQPLMDINDRGQCQDNQNFLFGNLSTIAHGTLTHFWDFGDGNTSNLDEPSHVYTSYGNYQIKLISTSEYNCIDSSTTSIDVFSKPLASFDINDSTQCINAQNFLFTSTSSTPQGSLSQYQWTITDGGNYTGPSANHSFNTSGIFGVKLVVITDSGCLDSLVKPIRVFPKPISDFAVNDSAQCIVGNDYIFTETAFDSFGIKSYLWNIAGEHQATTQTVNYNFSGTGFKSIGLIVESVNSCLDTTLKDVFVKQMPNPGFTNLSSFYCQSDSVLNLIPITPGGTFFGRNVSGSTFIPQNLWEDTVRYIVTVNGCTDSSSQNTNVLPLPVAKLGNDTLLCRYAVLNLDVTSWNSQYIWDNGSTRPKRTIDRAGLYWVTATNICGEDSDSLRVEYRPVNCHFFIPTAFTPNGDNKNDIFTPVLVNVEHMNLSIYNRWGEKVYEGDMSSPGWDGNFGDKPAQMDAYIWVVDYSFFESGTLIKLSERGDVTLIR